MTLLRFPTHFDFGTSTAATQTETAFEHDWQHVVARDGQVFDRTTDHEARYEEDVDIICSLAPAYRTNLMWSKLQRAPFSALDEVTCKHYHVLLNKIAQTNKIMLVLHHFANPLWFVNRGGWQKKENVKCWVDFAKRTVDEFGRYVSSWNTFNEPNLYVSMGWVAGEFPPFKKNQFFMAKRVLQNIASAHSEIYHYIKSKYPDTSVGISHNCTVFEAHNALGIIPAAVTDYLYMDYAASLFPEVDFFGMSYYARIAFDPYPITWITSPYKIERYGKRHDDMWEYYPQGLRKCIKRYWTKFQKPIVITENGVCTNDDGFRIEAIQTYLRIVHECLSEGIDIRGYYHWSTWDNFEWNLGPSYRFGLYACDWETKKRSKKMSADFYSRIAHSRVLELL